MQDTPPDEVMAELRAAIAKLPDTAGFAIEDNEYGRWEIVRSYAIGMRTDDPGLVIRLRRTR